MSTASDPNQAPTLSCPRCQQPFPTSAASLDGQAKCQNCGCFLRVTRDASGVAEICQEESAERSTVASHLHDPGATLPPTPMARLRRRTSKAPNS